MPKRLSSLLCLRLRVRVWTTFLSFLVFRSSFQSQSLLQTALSGVGNVFRAMTRWFGSFFLAAVLAVIPSVAEIPDIEECEDSKSLEYPEWLPERQFMDLMWHAVTCNILQHLATSCNLVEKEICLVGLTPSRCRSFKALATLSTVLLLVHRPYRSIQTSQTSQTTISSQGQSEPVRTSKFS